MRFLTAGESHGQALTVIVEGCPAGLALAPGDIDLQLARRQRGAGRGERQRIERDRAEILSGVRHGETLGTPIALLLRNADHDRWKDVMAVERDNAPRWGAVTVPRPGHADLPGALKYGRKDARDILERASARETAARVAAGAVARRLLQEAGIALASCVLGVGSVLVEKRVSFEECSGLNEDMPIPDAEAQQRALDLVGQAAARGETLGGRILVMAAGVPPGLGSHVHWDRRLDARLAAHFLSIPSVKGVEIGDAITASLGWGSEAHDTIACEEGRSFRRMTNHAGGIEGGMSNGEEIRVTAFLKPLPTLKKPLPSVDLVTKQAREAHAERSDVCAVPAAAVVGEAVMALCLAEALCEKFGGDSLGEFKRNLEGYRCQLKEF